MNKKTLLSLSLAAALSACVGAYPRSSPAAVTDDDIAWYQSGMERGCTDEGKRHGDDPAAVSRFCGCVLNSFKATLSRERWQQAVYAAQHHDEKGEAAAVWGTGPKPTCQKGS